MRPVMHTLSQFVRPAPPSTGVGPWCLPDAPEALHEKHIPTHVPACTCNCIPYLLQLQLVFLQQGV
jgi:hypothetical protein